jgi:hypothetical protein
VRDTLAGIFDAPRARRFTYAPLTPWLLVVAALALLGSVAARRLVLPTLLLPKAKAQSKSVPTPSPRRQDTQASADAPSRSRADSVPNAPAPPPRANPVPPPPPPRQDAAPTRPLTAAERIAQKRRERR